MRIADSMNFEQIRGNINKNRSQMSDLQNQAATQKRVTKPSDDPMSAARVLSSRIDLQGNKQYIKNLNYAKSFLETTDQAIGDITESLTRAKELALSQANDASSSEESRRVVASEIEQIFNQVVSVGNRKLGDRFIFGGFKTQTKPFDQEGKYHGDKGEMLVHLDKETFLPMNVAGDQVFLGEGLSPDGLIHGSDDQATTIEQFRTDQIKVNGEPEPNQTKMPPGFGMRGPASIEEEVAPLKIEAGINLFSSLKGLEIALRTDDKTGVQESLDTIDNAIKQIIMSRAQVGARASTINGLLETMEKNKVTDQINISLHEDADVFSTVSDINKTESTLQATLQTSGKLMMPSLLSFLG